MYFELMKLILNSFNIFCIWQCLSQSSHYIDKLLFFFQNVDVSDLPGVGRTNSHKFRSMGIETCEQLQEKSLGFLKQEFGVKLGQSIYNFCRGIDDRPINFVQERKSVSAEVNYGIRFNNQIEMERFLGQLSDEVAMRLVKSGNLKGRQITLKVMVSYM